MKSGGSVALTPERVNCIRKFLIEIHGILQLEMAGDMVIVYIDESYVYRRHRN